MMMTTMTALTVAMTVWLVVRSVSKGCVGQSSHQCCRRRCSSASPSSSLSPPPSSAVLMSTSGWFVAE